MRDINWRAWNDAAFEESRRSGKPVFLSVAATWCHWCHVMDETTYSVPEVIRLINDNFIPIRVDNDRNPDINARYNMGGWPSTVFLTHTRDVIFGATYIPPAQMVSILERVSQAYELQRDDIIKEAEQARAELNKQLKNLEAGKADLSDYASVLYAVQEAYDPEFGGFGVDQKFPLTNALELLLFNTERTGSPDDLTKLATTLDQMISGEIFDKVEGGMFRYATQRDWTVPHYEKMLDDNARIASILLDAYRLTDTEEYLHTAQGIFRYLDKTLLDHNTGAYFGSQDADEEYYAMNLEERHQAQTPRVDTAVYTDSNSALALAWLKYYGVGRSPEARQNALRIVDFFNDLPRGVDGTAAHYYENGEAHEYGNLIDSVMLALANIGCYEATGTEDYLQKARDLIDTVRNAFTIRNGGLLDISETRARERGLSRYSLPLDENSIAARCLTKLAIITGHQDYIDRAHRILNAVADSASDYGMMAADYALAVALAHFDPVVVTISMGTGHPPPDQFIQAALSTCNSTCSIKILPGGTEEPPSATVCIGTICHAQVHMPDQLTTELAHAIAKDRE